MLDGQPVLVEVTAYNNAGNVVSGAPNTRLFYLYTDHLGSVVALANPSGNIVGGVTRYEPFGDYRGAAPSTNPGVSDLGFTGHRENRDIGLTYMNARLCAGGGPLCQSGHHCAGPR